MLGETYNDAMMLWVMWSAVGMLLIPGLVALAITYRHDHNPAWKQEPLGVEPMDQAEIYNFEEFAQERENQLRAEEASRDSRKVA